MMQIGMTWRMLLLSMVLLEMSGLLEGPQGLLLWKWKILEMLRTLLEV